MDSQRNRRKQEMKGELIMARYYEATNNSHLNDNMSDIMIATANMLNLIECSKNIYSLSELRKEYSFDVIYKILQTAIVYDDTNELELETTAFKSYPIIFELINDAGEPDVISYYDRSTTGINADIVVCIEEDDKWVSVNFPDEDNSITISDGKISVS